MPVIKKQMHGVVAVYQYLDDFCKVIENIKSRNDFSGHVVFSPTSYHELMDLAHERYGSSQVRWFTLTGALLGVFTGFGMCLWMDHDWPTIVGGKISGIYSLPAYVVFGFELMVLFGAIATIMGMLVMGRLPNPKATILDTRTTDDRFAVYVPGADLDSEQSRLLKEWGAEEVYRAFN